MTPSYEKYKQCPGRVPSMTPTLLYLPKSMTTMGSKSRCRGIFSDFETRSVRLRCRRCGVVLFRQWTSQCAQCRGQTHRLTTPCRPFLAVKRKERLVRSELHLDWAWFCGIPSSRLQSPAPAPHYARGDPGMRATSNGHAPGAAATTDTDGRD